MACRTLRFNLKREAAPVATTPLSLYGMQNTAFQSQTRSRPSCHHAIIAVWHAEYGVSISNEKPPQLPPRHYRCMACRIRRFNLKREAAPVATEEGATHMREPFPVSISNEKPPQLPQHDAWQSDVLNDKVSISNEKPPQLPRATIQDGEGTLTRFQSQTRSRPSCHLRRSQSVPQGIKVSISNEKPPQLPLL